MSARKAGKSFSAESQVMRMIKKALDKSASAVLIGKMECSRPVAAV